MQLTSLGFLCLLIIGLGLFYGLPRKFQPFILLLMSAIFYTSFSVKMVGFIICTTLTTFYGAKKISSMDKKNKNRKRLLVFLLFLNFGLLGFVKYTGFLVNNIMSIASKFDFDFGLPGITILAPIGISFYTFQMTGYLLDVYWKREEAEKSLFRYAIFASFFPQIMQGPISKYNQLSKEIFKKHDFDIETIQRGALLIVWGFFKKIIIADTMAVAVSRVFDTGDYYGVEVIVGVLAYCAQLYCDFSGGIDVIRGAAKLFGIDMVDNFKRPFFSKSISEFWRRWHITLGIWMKDYVFYPLSLSKWMTKFGSKCRKTFGNQLGRKLPICIANIIIFLLVGVWHGPNWNFICYGLYNGLVIAISSLLTPFYDWLYKVSTIPKKSKFMATIQVARTFILVNIGWYFDRATGLGHTIQMIARTFSMKASVVENGTYLGLYKYQYGYVVFALVVLIIVEVMQEKGIKIYDWLKAKPIVIQYVILFILIFSIPIMGYYSPNSNMVGGFMYANF